MIIPSTRLPCPLLPLFSSLPFYPTISCILFPSSLSILYSSLFPLSLCSPFFPPLAFSFSPPHYYYLLKTEIVKVFLYSNIHLALQTEGPDPDQW